MRLANEERPPGRGIAIAGGAALLALALAVGLAARASMRPAEPQVPEAGQQAAQPADDDTRDEGATVPQNPNAPDGPAQVTGEAEAPDNASNSDEPSEGRLWAESLERGERLAGYTDEQLDDLEAGVWDWMDAYGWAVFGDRGLVECTMGPQAVDGDPAVTSRVWMRVKGSRVYLQCDWFDGAGRWRVVKVSGTVEGLNDSNDLLTGPAGEVELTDLKSMRALLDKEAADALDRQWGALYGRGGRPGVAFVFPSEAVRADSWASLVIRYAAADGAADPVTIQTEATWDASTGAWSLADVPLTDPPSAS